MEGDKCIEVNEGMNLLRESVPLLVRFDGCKVPRRRGGITKDD